eukprot:364500-Chlamydomonas_euryale.AAC.22
MPGFAGDGDEQCTSSPQWIQPLPTSTLPGYGPGPQVGRPSRLRIRSRGKPGGLGRASRLGKVARWTNYTRSTRQTAS